MKDPKRTEELLASHAMKYWQADGWEIFPEVQIYSYGKRADMIGRRGNLIAAIECKQSLTFDVIAQARNWWFYAHAVYVAVWREKSGRASGRSLAYQACEHFGVGVVEFDEGGAGQMVVHARKNRKPDAHLSERLHDGHKAYAPGNARAEYWSPFRQTCNEARRAVKKHGGRLALKILMAEIKHHYSSEASARSSFSKWLERGKIPGLLYEREGRQVIVAIDASAKVPDMCGDDA